MNLSSFVCGNKTDITSRIIKDVLFFFKKSDIYILLGTEEVTKIFCRGTKELVYNYEFNITIALVCRCLFGLHFTNYCLKSGCPYHIILKWGGLVLPLAGRLTIKITAEIWPVFKPTASQSQGEHSSSEPPGLVTFSKSVMIVHTWLWNLVVMIYSQNNWV